MTQLYQVIYADPPWTYKDHMSPGKSRWIGYKYNIMTVEQIAALPVARLAAEDCMLFMWMTPPTLPDGLKVMEEWGFTFKTKAFCWVKKNKVANSFFWGAGHYTRQNTEDCYVGVRGRPKRISACVHQVIYESRREHSRKPDTARDRIVQLCGDVPRIELFARQQHMGWDVWGDQVEGGIEFP